MTFRIGWTCLVLWMATGCGSQLPEDGFPAKTEMALDALPAPSGLVATVGDGQVALQWNDYVYPSGYTAWYFVVFIYKNGVQFRADYTPNGINETWTATGLTNGDTYTIKVLARPHEGVSPLSVGVTVTPQKSWNVTATPPTLVNPITLTLPGNYLATIQHSLCTGPGYVVTLDNTKDYIIRTDAILHAPIWINGGRNVRVIGIHIDLDASPCAGAGLSGYAPGAIALRLAQVGTTFVEGAYVDVRGLATDCFVIRNLIGNYEALQKINPATGTYYTATEARGQRDIIIQNSVCRGVRGDSNVHGDLLQSQGAYEVFRNITLENVSVDSSCEGTVVLGRCSPNAPNTCYPGAESLKTRRFDYRTDARYMVNFDGTTYWRGGALMNSATSYVYDTVYSALAAGGIYEMTPQGTSTLKSCSTPGIYCGATPATERFASPGGSNASETWVGLRYSSPHP